MLGAIHSHRKNKTDVCRIQYQNAFYCVSGKIPTLCLTALVYAYDSLFESLTSIAVFDARRLGRTRAAAAAALVRHCGRRRRHADLFGRAGRRRLLRLAAAPGEHGRDQGADDAQGHVPVDEFGVIGYLCLLLRLSVYCACDDGAASLFRERTRLSGQYQRYCARVFQVF